MWAGAAVVPDDALMYGFGRSGTLPLRNVLGLGFVDLLE